MSCDCYLTPLPSKHLILNTGEHAGGYSGFDQDIKEMGY